MKTNYWLNRNRLLSHLRTSFCALAIAGASLTLPSAEAGGPPLPASGDFFPCFNFAAQPRQVGENLIVNFDVTVTSTGTLIGSGIGTELDVVHSDGSINLHGTLLFTGSINGGPEGTLTFTYQGTAVNGHETLHGVGGQGTDGLAGVQANITLEGDAVPPEPGCAASGVGAYTGQILFTP